MAQCWPRAQHTQLRQLSLGWVHKGEAVCSNTNKCVSAASWLDATEGAPESSWERGWGGGRDEVERGPGRDRGEDPEQPKTQGVGQPPKEVPRKRDRLLFNRLFHSLYMSVCMCACVCVYIQKSEANLQESVPSLSCGSGDPSQAICPSPSIL